MKSIMTLAASLVIASFANAGELDNNQPNVSSTETTIVVRVNKATGAVEKVELNQALNEQDAQALATDSSVQFEKAKKGQIRSELDQESGASSWYWYCPQYSTPGWGWGNNYNTGFNNYGYWYSNYYNYSYGNYNYYYYQPYYGNNYGCNGWNNWNYSNSCNNNGWGWNNRWR